jgi:phospholipid/cholesterol/gamma-HCH transport system substrate-binding protein
MEDKFNPTVVGAFVLVLGAALIAGVLWLAVGVSSKTHYAPYQSVIRESVAGLNIDAPVKYLGVDVGKVQSIAIDPNNSSQVRLGLSIQQGTPVKHDSEAVLKTQGLTGIAYLELSGGSPGAAPLLPTAKDPIPLIRSKPSLSTRLETVLGTVLTGLDHMSGNLNAVFDADNRAALKQMLADAAVLTRTLAAQKDAIASGVADASRTAHLASQASVRLGPALTQITTSARSVQEMAQAANTLATTADAGMQQVRTETLPQLERLIAEMSQLAISMHQLSQQLERNPSSLLVGSPKRPAGPGEQTTP